MSDLIRGALRGAIGAYEEIGGMEPEARETREALALLDGVTGLAREGDVVLSAEQADKLSGGISAICTPLPECRALRDKLLALLASGRTGEERA